MKIKYCSTCKKKYPNCRSFCSICGGPLIAVIDKKIKEEDFVLEDFIDPPIELIIKHIRENNKTSNKIIWNKIIRNKTVGENFGLLGVMSAVTSLFLYPLVFGPLAIMMGIIGILNDDLNLSLTSITLGIIFPIFSLILRLYLIGI